MGEESKDQKVATWGSEAVDALNELLHYKTIEKPDGTIVVNSPSGSYELKIEDGYLKSLTQVSDKG